MSRSLSREILRPDSKLFQTTAEGEGLEGETLHHPDSLSDGPCGVQQQTPVPLPLLSAGLCHIFVFVRLYMSMRMCIVTLTNYLRFGLCASIGTGFFVKVCLYVTWCMWRLCFMGQSDLYWVQWALSLAEGDHSPAQSPSLPRPHPLQPLGKTDCRNTDAPLGLIDVLDKPLTPPSTPSPCLYYTLHLTLQIFFLAWFLYVYGGANFCM